MAQFPAVIKTSVIELRFAFAGKIVWVGKKSGDLVKSGEAIASLDRKTLQMELDRQLADYEKARAEFELHIIKVGKDPGSDEDKYQRQIKQAQLNASVKEVELSKYKLDQTALVSPIEGTVVLPENVIAGIYCTPASHPVSVIATTLFATSQLSLKDLPLFREPRTVTITIYGKQYPGTTRRPIWQEKTNYLVITDITDATDLSPGMTGKLSDKVTVK